MVYVSAQSATVANFVLTPRAAGTDPVVGEVHARYCGPGRHAYYLAGPPLDETFTATIDWKAHPPGKVRWIKSNDPWHPIEDPCPGTTVVRQFNMGSDFGEDGTLTVIAVSGDSPPIESEPYLVSFRVIPRPPIVALVPTVGYQPWPSGEKLEYRVLGLQGAEISLATWEATQVHTSFPLFGGQELKVAMKLEEDPGPFSAELSGTVDSDGKCTLVTLGWDHELKKYIRKGVKCTKGMKLPFVEFGVEASVEFDFYWSDYHNAWMPGGEVKAGCDFRHSSPQIPIGVIVFIPIYLRAEQSLDLEATLGIYGWTAQGPVWAGQFGFEPMMKGIVGAGLAGVACVEGYAGGGLHTGAQYLPEFHWVDPYIIIVVGVQATLGPFSFGPLELKHCWPEECEDKSLSLDELLRGRGAVLLPRDYLKYRQSGGRFGQPPALLRDGFEHWIEQAVFPYSTPEVEPIGQQTLAVWIADNTQLTPINRTELRYGTYDGVTWSGLVPVVGDGTADLNPRLVSLPGGDAVVCIWQDANAVLSETDPLEVLLSHLEIAAARYDVSSGNWSPVTRITNDAILDRSPSIAAAGTDDLLAVWVSNGANDPWGSAGAPNTIRWSHFDGAGWTTPTELATGFGTILDTALAYDGATATFVFCTDADDDLDTLEDQELWAATYAAGVWSTPVQLTSDLVCDAAPRLAYDTGGILRLVWLKGDDVRFATGTNVSNSSVVVTPTESMGSKDFDLVTSPSGRIALVWNDASETYHDLWISYFEPAQDAWSKPRQLTFDDSAECFIAGTFDADDNLLCVYDKTQTVYVDQQVQIGGQMVVVEDVPQPGQSDLCYLHYHLAGDLAVSVEDVNVIPPNPSPGTEATLTAVVRNIGESPASNVEVGFYDGDPDGGGTLIHLAVIEGPLVGGGEAEASAAWSVPASTEPRLVYVRVDPNLQQEDRDRMNNTARFPVLTPDLTVSEIRVQAAGPDRLLTVRLENKGVLPAFNVGGRLCARDPAGSVLAEFEVPELPPGTYQDLAYRWSPPPAPTGVVTVWALVDPANAIDELDEDNNARSALVPVSAVEPCLRRPDPTALVPEKEASTIQR